MMERVHYSWLFLVMGVTYVLNCNSHIFVCEGDIAL